MSSSYDFTEITCYGAGTGALSPMKVHMSGSAPPLMNGASFLPVFKPPPGLESIRPLSPPPGLDNDRSFSPPPGLEKEAMSSPPEQISKALHTLPPMKAAVPANGPPGFFVPKRTPMQNDRSLSPPPGLGNDTVISIPSEPERNEQHILPPMQFAPPVNRPPGVFAPKGNPNSFSLPRLQRAAYASIHNNAHPYASHQTSQPIVKLPGCEPAAQNAVGLQASPQIAAGQRKFSSNFASKGHTVTSGKRSRGTTSTDDIEQTKSQCVQLLTVIKSSGAESALTLHDALPHILELAKDKDGVQYLLARLDDTKHGVKMLCQAVLTETCKLSVDEFGHILISKLLEVAAKEQQWALAVHLVNSAKQLTCDVHGCRVVQTALQHVAPDLQIELAEGLKDSVVHCIRNIHGNHVVQMCVEQLKPESVAFIIDAVNTWGAEKASVHPYACRVVMRLLEYCQKQEHFDEMCEHILGNARMLAMNRYGNYVVQHILEHGDLAHKQNIVMCCIRSDILELARHKYAHNVVQKCLRVENLTMSHALLAVPLEDLVNDRFGAMVVQLMIELSSGATRKLLMQQLAALNSQLADSQIDAAFLETIVSEISLQPGEEL